MTRIEKKRLQKRFNILFHLIHDTCHMHMRKNINTPSEIVKRMERTNKELNKVKKEMCPACMALDELSAIMDSLGLD